MSDCLHLSVVYVPDDSGWTRVLCLRCDKVIETFRSDEPVELEGDPEGDDE